MSLIGLVPTGQVELHNHLRQGVGSSVMTTHRYLSNSAYRRAFSFCKSAIIASVILMLSGLAWADDPHNRQLYGRVLGGLPVSGGTQIPGESIDLRKGMLGWETLDVLLPGNGGLDIEIYRQFMSNERIERAMEDWSLSLPRITMSTNAGGHNEI